MILMMYLQWASVAADYNCRLPVNTPPIKVFLLTFFGLFIPITFVEILGAALMTITHEDYVDAFTDGGTGGLLGQVLSPWKGGGKFILFLLAFSVMYVHIILYLFGTNATPLAQTTYPIPTPPVFLSKPWAGLLRWSLDSSGHSSASLSIPLQV